MADWEEDAGNGEREEEEGEKHFEEEEEEEIEQLFSCRFEKNKILIDLLTTLTYDNTYSSKDNECFIEATPDGSSSSLSFPFPHYFPFFYLPFSCSVNVFCYREREK